MHIINSESHQPHTVQSNSRLTRARRCEVLPAVDSESALEKQADALLAAAGCFGRQSGVFTEAQINRKIRTDQECSSRVEAREECDEAVEYVIGQRLDELVDLARLSPMQEICFRYFAAGLSVRKLVSALKLSRHRVTIHLRTARRKVRAVCNEGPYAGWYEVYLSEMRRGKPQ